ncbi:hypothetical protein [Alkalibacillus haloalkaliphilus]|uniref:Uncharacterized protein n=1 Tax=Alkalibacillus haloalkaliphilus TaxID=94136 RepID=A0A511W3X8_9BACI|nr:hypothetical protein [Alkalibacillus haloalkaliphilus]GEN45048.1 hypothetical protein AHA02nite_08240 [Alkalibacillus haloalkaliphilus]
MSTLLIIILLSYDDFNFDPISNDEYDEKSKIELLEDPSLKENALLPLPPNIVEEPFENELIPLPEETPVPDFLDQQN